MSGARTVLRLGAALLLAGVAFAAPSLLVPGALLVLLPLAVATWIRLAARGARLRRSGLPARVVEGQPFDVRLSVCSGLLPMTASLAEPTLERPVRVRCVLPRRDFVLDRVGSLQRRGRHPLPPPALRLADPLGIGACEIRGGKTEAILVLPRIEPIRGPEGGPGPSAGMLSKGPGEIAGGGAREAPADPELDGLRPYRSGSPASRIYWPALARSEELVERRLAAGRGSSPLVALDASGGADAAALDQAVRAAASLCFHLSRRGGCELLLPAASRRMEIGSSAASWAAAHAALALVEAGQGAPHARDLPCDAPLFWVRASALGGMLPAAHGFLIAPGSLPGRSAAFSVAGCAAYALERGGRRRSRRGVAA